MTHITWVNGSHPAKKHHRSDVETLAAMKAHLRSVLKEVSPGVWVYDSPWNDARCAEKFGVPTYNVASNRNSWFGNLWKPEKAKPVAPDPAPPKPSVEDGSFLTGVEMDQIYNRLLHLTMMLKGMDDKLDALLAMWAPKNGGAA